MIVPKLTYEPEVNCNIFVIFFSCVIVCLCAEQVPINILKPKKV